MLFDLNMPYFIILVSLLSSCIVSDWIKVRIMPGVVLGAFRGDLTVPADGDWVSVGRWKICGRIKWE